MCSHIHVLTLCLCPKHGRLDYDQINYHFDGTISPFRKTFKLVVNQKCWRFKSVSVGQLIFVKKLSFLRSELGPQAYEIPGVVSPALATCPVIIGAERRYKSRSNCLRLSLLKRL